MWRVQRGLGTLIRYHRMIINILKGTRLFKFWSCQGYTVMEQRLKQQLKLPKGNNSQSIKARVIIHVGDKLS